VLQKSSKLDYYSGGLSVATYDLFTGGGLLNGDVAFYLDFAKKHGGPILELATGTGRILLPLVLAGHHVVGMDISSAMLEIAAAKIRNNSEAADRARLIQGNIINFDLGQHFATILIPARSFQHVLTPDDQRKTLHCVRRHLRPGGHLVLDLVDPYFDWLFGEAWKESPPKEVLLAPSNHLVRRTIVSCMADPLRQTVHETMRFEEFDEGGNIIACEDASWTLRWNMRQETEYLLELCGFEVVDQYSDFFFSPPAYAKEQLWIARLN
jgi:SAM-dependent methyltransferase